MSAEFDKTGSGHHAELLSRLESGLQEYGNDEAMLADIGIAMRSLLSDSGASETQIRDTLQKQFDAGHLRQETYELVQNLLGKIATEELVRVPPPESSSIAEEIFAATAVIEDQAEAQIQMQTRAEPEPVVEHQLQVGSILRDRFLLKEKISEGSMGVVYKALDRRLAEAGETDCYVAIKVLSPQLARNGTALRALQQEAAKGRYLTHPHIVRFIDLDREDELYFIVMEWLEGYSLSRILDGNGDNVLDLSMAFDIVRQAAEALDYAHQRGIVHADVKPGNIIVTPDGTIKLIDFGVARVMQKKNAGKSHIDPAVVQTGAPAYSSMQVLTGEDPVPADDVFSLACLFYRLIAGYRVYGPRNAAQAAEEGMEPQRPQGLSSALWQPVKKALSYSRVTRHASPSAFVAALNAKIDAASMSIDRQQRPAEAVAAVPDIRVSPAAAKRPAVIDTVLSTPSRISEESPLFNEISTGDEINRVQEFPIPSSDCVAPIRAENDSIMYEPDDDEPRRSFWGLAILSIVAIGAAVIATQSDWVDRIGRAVETRDVTPITDLFNTESEIIDAPYIDESAQDIAEYAPVDESNSDIREESNDDAPIAATVPDTETTVAQLALPDAAPVVEKLPAVDENLIDWSLLPPPNATVTLALASSETRTVTLAVREDSTPAIVDFLRNETTEAMTIELLESEYTGNRSPWEAGQYGVEHGGVVTFAIGQDRARLSISMRSNPVREADREVTLLIRERGNAQATLATIELTLEDDDQRSFEESLPPNTVAFAVNQVSVRESDPAAQIDVLRYKPDDTALELGYELTGVTATEGQDFFAPDIAIVYFRPGQRTARILIPLGHDTRPEDDEAFMLELISPSPSASADARLFSQIAVMIRDDDS